MRVTSLSGVAAESADAEDSTISPKVSDKKLAARISTLKRLNGHDLRVDVLNLASRRDRALAEQFLTKLKSDRARASDDATNTRAKLRNDSVVREM